MAMRLKAQRLITKLSSPLIAAALLGIAIASSSVASDAWTNVDQRHSLRSDTPHVVADAAGALVSPQGKTNTLLSLFAMIAAAALASRGQPRWHRLLATTQTPRDPARRPAAARAPPLLFAS